MAMGAAKSSLFCCGLGISPGYIVRLHEFVKVTVGSLVMHDCEAPVHRYECGALGVSESHIMRAGRIQRRAGVGDRSDISGLWMGRRDLRAVDRNFDRGRINGFCPVH